MARKKASVEYNNFTKGFITEASPLTFPENASLDEENMNINKDGSRQRRFGMDWTESASAISKTSTLPSNGFATSSYSWFSAGNDGTHNLAVLQHGSHLYFYDLEETDIAASLVDTVDLDTFFIGMDRTYPFEYTTAYGELFIATNSDNIAVLSWDGINISVRRFKVAVRDVWGVEDGFDIDEQTTTSPLDNNHRYNLYNQGFPSWMTVASDAGGSTPSLSANPIDYTYLQVGFYPSNADLVWASKLAAVSGLQVDNIDAFSPWELSKSLFGTTPAPKGKIILDNIFTRGFYRFTNSPITSTVATDQTYGGIKSVSAFAGRLWYTIEETGLLDGDDNSPRLGNMVLYSQASEDFSRWKSCHSRNDPTAETFSDVLASDGGFISIPESGKIFKTVPLGESLFVFATNGVWEIFGGETTFSASQQSVLKVTDIGALSQRSIISGGNLIGYWTDSGIYGISLEPQTLRGIATNITEGSIQEYYDDIPTNQKRNAVGSYDTVAKQVSWLYNLTDKDSDYYFDKELIFDTVHQAFTKRSIKAIDVTDAEGPYITTAIRLRNILRQVTDEVVTDSSVAVTAGGVDVTITITSSEQKTKTALMYWMARSILTQETLILGGYTDPSFTDYPQLAVGGGVFGTDAPAFMLTGYLTGGDSSRTKYLPYITVKLKRTESDWSIDGNGDVTVIGESSCTMQAQWQWTNNALAGKWSTPQQVYRLPRFFTLDDSHNLSYDVINTRNKVKGSGDAVSLKFSSSPGKDMVLLGWGVDVELDEKV